MFEIEQFNQINNEFDERKNAHSYLFNTNDFFSCKKDLYKLISNILDIKLDDVINNIYMVNKSEKKSILKDEILNIKEQFITTSYLYNYKICVIEEVHKLNKISANMLLKLIEEPEKNYLFFFITDNIDCVIDTIKSRCQIINCFYKLDKNNEMIDKDNCIIELFESDNVYLNNLTIKKNLEKFDRDDIINTIKNYIIYLSVNPRKNIFKIKVLNNMISLLLCNVNVDYVFDYYILEVSKNEIN